MKPKRQQLHRAKCGLAALGLSLSQTVALPANATNGNSKAAMIEAEVIAPGVNCPRVRLQTGEEISLMGFSRTIAPGTRVQLSGDFVLRSNCQQGRTLHVASFTIVTP